MSLATIEIDATPANVRAMMNTGQFHAHQDGRWRYSPYGAETVYVNDPTAQFEARCDNASACKPLAIYATHYRDGTRGLWKWNATQAHVLWQIYGPRDNAERLQREWLNSTFAD